ncbi:MAG TPA: hypothetical protein VEX38_07300, partial [Fimbriimonadaceae bacterium]|nr:hypothetical protein [Fimbriimonadaceae bacterium]
MVRDAIPRSFGGDPQPIHAVVNDLFVKVERLETGRFRLLDFAPEESTDRTQLPFDVQINGVRVLLEDRTSKPIWRRWVSSQGATVAGLGDRWLASTRARIQGSGVVQAQVRNDPDSGLSLTGVAEALDLAPILRHVVTTPDVKRFPILRDVQARTLIATGPIQLFLPPEGKGEPSFAANVRATTTGLLYARQYGVDRGTFRGVITSEGLRGEVEGATAGLSGVYRGSFGWGDTTATAGSVTARIASSAQTPKWFRGYLPQGLAFQNGDFSGWVSYAAGGGVRVDGDFKASRATFSGESITAPGITVSATDKRVAIRLDRGAWNGSPIRGALNLNPNTKQLEGLLEARNIPVHTVAKRFNITNVQGIADVRALISGRSDSPNVAVRGQGNLRANLDGRRVDLGRVEVAANLADQLLQLSRVSVTGPNGVLSAGGRWNTRTNQLDLQVLARNLPLGAIQSDLGGTASFAGQISGSLKNPQASGRLEAYDVRVAGEQLPVIMADVRGNQNRIVAENLLGFRGPARIQGAVALDLRSRALDGVLSARGIQLSEWLGQDVSGLVNVTSATVGGTLQSPKATANVQASSIVAKGVRIDGLTMVAKVDD